MPTAVLVCGGDVGLWQESGLAGELKPLPREEVGEMLAEKNVIFLRSEATWSDCEMTIATLRSMSAIPIFRVMNAARFRLDLLEAGDRIIFVGNEDGSGWIVAEVQ
jgi:hypothetical protein